MDWTGKNTHYNVQYIGYMLIIPLPSRDYNIEVQQTQTSTSRENPFDYHR